MSTPLTQAAIITDTTADALPPIRWSLDEARADLDAVGFTRLGGLLDDDGLAAIRSRLAEQAAGEQVVGTAFMEGPNQRVLNLANKGRAFRDWMTHPTLMTLMESLLGPHFTMFSLTANIAAKGHPAMYLHTDQSFSGIQDRAVLFNMILMLVDFSEENGGTRIVPGSHRFGHYPEQADQDHPTVAATGPAGCLFIFDGRLWHGTGTNRTDVDRPGILTTYSKPFIRAQENYALSTSPAVLEDASPLELRLLGFQTAASGGMLGNVDGSLPGTLNRRPVEFSRELGAP